MSARAAKKKTKASGPRKPKKTATKRSSGIPAAARQTKASTAKGKSAAKKGTVSAARVRTATTAKKSATMKKTTKVATKAGRTVTSRASTAESTPAKSKDSAKKKAPKTQVAIPRTRSTTKTTTRKAKRPTAKVVAKASRAEKAARRRRLRGFRKRLFERQQALMQSYTSNKDTRTPNIDGTEDYIDYAVSSYDRDFMLSLSEMDRHQLRLVEEALKRIDRGEFGRCLQCSVEIPVKRLEVEPWARHCIRCQELDEQGLLDDITSETDLEEDEMELEGQPGAGGTAASGEGGSDKSEADLEDEYQDGEADENSEVAR